ncbi:DUF5709 domain-containing protein [Ornithinimicrobium pratense]|uniref:DUF5709 domain-containing protein n=1 Tax=Ornithinimicrobium pratense TaxID=2593973 RepID=UPI00178821B7|nr:DUF5709 domain-containing protein [Ornithinimicrobium pratense]
MSDQADRETMGDEFGVYSVDAEDQLQPGDTLDGEGDVLDRGFRVGERYQWSNAYAEETIDVRVRQEDEDPSSAYGAPRDESGMDAEDDGWIGGDDPDAIRAELDYYGNEQQRVGRIVAPDEGRFPDREARLIAREGQATSWDSPEESAMHYVDDAGGEDLGSSDAVLAEVEWDPQAVLVDEEQ